MAVNKQRTTKKQVTKTTFWSPLRVISTLFVLALLAALGVSSCNSNDSTEPTISSAPAKVNPPAGASNVGALTTLPSSVRDTELVAAEGEPIKLSNYSGKVLLVNLWATWCGPCRMETPELVKLHKEYGSRGVEMVGLSTEDPEASATSVRNFMKAFSVDYRIGWATPDVAGILMQGRGSIPQSFIINRDGQIIKRFVGFRPGDQPEDTPQQIRQAIEIALKG